MYILDINQESSFLNYLKYNVNLTPCNIFLCFKYVDNDILFIKHVVFWLANMIKNHDDLKVIYIRHNFDKPSGFVIKNIKNNLIYFLKIHNKLFYISLEISPDQSYIHNYYEDLNYAENDFWTCCITEIAYTQMLVSKSSIIKHGYIGGEIYQEFFFNSYGIEKDLVAQILHHVVFKRNYIDVKDIWINIDEFIEQIRLCQEDTLQNVNIHGNFSNITDEDVSYLLYKTLIAISLNTVHGIITNEFITCLDGYKEFPLIYHVGDKNSRYDNWGNFNAFSYVINNDYDNRYIKSSSICIQYLDMVRFLGDPIPEKYHLKLFNELQKST